MRAYPESSKAASALVRKHARHKATFKRHRQSLQPVLDHRTALFGRDVSVAAAVAEWAELLNDSGTSITFWGKTIYCRTGLFGDHSPVLLAPGCAARPVQWYSPCRADWCPFLDPDMLFPLLIGFPLSRAHPA